jgi:putative flippase GtrA
MLHKLWEYKKLRFICVGSFNSLCDISTLNALVFLVHLPVWLANTISVSFGITLSYFLNHHLVFRHHNRPNIKLFLKFFAVTGFGVILLQTLVIYLTRPVFRRLIHDTNALSLIRVENSISLNLAKITAIFIGLFWNYFFYSRIVFKKMPELESEIQ